MGGIEMTIGRNMSTPNLWNQSDVKIFMKSMGSDNRVSPVEGLFQIFPFFLYLNATYGGWLLGPVFESASSNRWTFPYAVRDIG
ncbi:hypothetical protein EIP86_010093 [Pleurotus ostreatoroseus]|nr:hypothetical protein EIP86_010093 [Pleurotus ostreatoroseus]